MVATIAAVVHATGVPRMSEIEPAKPLTRTQQRILDGSYLIEVEDPKALLFQHTVLCQCAMPYRNPGDDVLTWDHTNGKASLRMRSGEIMIPGTNRWHPVGLPYGPKARLILMHLNAEALRKQSHVVELAESQRSFLARLRLDKGGRTMRPVKEQITRLALAQVSLAVVYSNDRSRQVQTQIIDRIDLWHEQDGDRRIRWPTVVELSPRYFADLQEHAVPLDERAIIALSNNCRALDIYAWLAQRLRRLSRPTLVSWAALQLQFGADHADHYRFRQLFRTTLALALSQYSAARVELGERGLTLFESPPPVRERRSLTRPVGKAL
jgi:hypothetical protein